MFTFVRQAVSSFSTTGSIVPSSRFLAREICGGVATGHAPMRILEAGAGSGAFTRRLLSRIGPDDTFVICEINPVFVEHLRRGVVEPFLAAHPRHDVTLVAGSILDAPIEPGFDAIICGIPLSNFPAALARAIMRRLRSLLAPGGELRYFEYVGLKTMGALVVTRSMRRRIRSHQAMRKALLRDHDGTVTVIARNVPPARVIRIPSRAAAG